LARNVFGGLKAALEEVHDNGTTEFLKNSLGHSDLNRLYSDSD